MTIDGDDDFASSMLIALWTTYQQHQQFTNIPQACFAIEMKQKKLEYD